MSTDTEEVKCAICNLKLIRENNSEEHIILQAIGGRRKIRNFICKSCNNKTGLSWDVELAQQLLPLSHMFDVSRQRGHTPDLAITTTVGEHLLMRSDGSFTLPVPTCKEEKTPDGKIKINLNARTLTEAKKMLDGIKRKHPSIDANQLLNNANLETSYLKGMVKHQLNFGGENSGKSIIKSALALACIAGIPAHMCQNAIGYLNLAAPACFGYYYATDLITDRPIDIPLHCVAIEANPRNGLILAYAEYFGVYRIVACLGKNYDQEPIKSCYALDPRTGNELNLTVRLNFDFEEIEAIYRYERIPTGALEAAFNTVIPVALKRKFEAEQKRVIDSAINYAFENCGAQYGEIINEKHFQLLTRLLAQKLTPFLIARSMSRNNPTSPCDSE